MSGQSGGHRVRLAKLNEQLTCKLCGGYFIDATTIIECLHSFCRSCIVKYLENNKYCPICEVQVHKSRPLLNIRPDHTLQDIVYKLVPGCYQNEMRCRREFYAKHPEVCSQAMSPEARGEPIESHIYSPDESLSLSLEYFNPHAKDLSEVNTTIKDGAQKAILRRYFRCPAAVTIFHLQKLIRAKYGLSDANRIDIMYKEEPLCSSYTLMDIMYIYHWRRKVPLHLSYRIFESSLKRMKLSEDNPNYKKSLKDAGMDSIELKDEKSLKREWKEVQLKISETGVMSITDISSTVHKRDESLQDGKSPEETITSIVEVNKADSSLIENCDVSKSSSVEIMQSTLAVDPSQAKTPTFPNSSNAPVATSDVKSTTEGSSIKNCTSPIAQHNGNTTKPKTETEARPVPKLQQEAKGRNQTANVEDKTGQKTVGQPVTQLAEESANIVAENTEGKKLSINNNNNSTDFKAETQKECVKTASVEAKTGNAGSKIDALSVKLQFQPKMGQVNNTYSKKAPKEKRAILQQGAKKSDLKSSTENAKLADAKTRTNCGNTKVSVSSSTTPPPQKSVVSTVTSKNTCSVTDSGRQEALHEKDNPSTSIDVQQALNLLEQKPIGSPVVQVSLESVPKTSTSQVTSQITSTLNQRLQGSSSNNNNNTNNNTSATSEGIVSTIVSSAPTATVSQATSSITFPYTLHDIVINSAAVKPALKNSSATSSCTTLQKALGTSPVVACSTSSSQASLGPPQFNVQPSMSIYSVSMSMKNNCGTASQGGTTVTATSTATITVTASKPTSVCSVPPCPDAIPISLMKQASLRKQEATAKGTNLNEICAKIGSIGTIGSKINDICAKIGENSKEKNRVEQARGKSDVPDLLKIGTKKSLSASSLPNSDATIKHIPNIPNVPVYNPSGNATTMENKSAKPGLVSAVSSTVTSLAATSSPHMTQRMSSLKKQSQPMGYKTLRDPPKSWNPTLSKNNYVALKNQAKELQNQTQTASASEGTSKQIPSKPAKIFKRNMLRYLGNPASGVKPIYGVANDAKEKEQSTGVANAKNVTLNMMKIDPKTLSPIVSTVNSPIVSPPSPYSPNARSYQNTPYPRDGLCRSTGSPISPRNSPVNMLSTNPFIPSPTPNTNPRIIYSHFPPPFPDASRFPNPLIRSPIGIPPPSAFHSSLPPAINKLYQRTSASYIPQTTGSYSPVSSQPPAVQRIPPSTHSSSPKSPKCSSPGSISCSTSFSLGKADSQSPITSTVADSVALLLSKNVPVPIPVSTLQRELNAFNLSKTGGGLGPPKTSSTDTSSVADSVETQAAKQASPSVSQSSEVSGNSSSSSSERKQSKDMDPAQRTMQEARPKEESPQKPAPEAVDGVASSPADKKEKNQTAKVNGDVSTDQFASKKSKEANGSDEATTPAMEASEREGQVERASSRERGSIPNSNAQDNNIGDSSPASESKSESKGSEIQGKKSEVQRNKAET